jgi:hypothetical protein
LHFHSPGLCAVYEDKPAIEKQKANRLTNGDELIDPTKRLANLSLSYTHKASLANLYCGQFKNWTTTFRSSFYQSILNTEK